MTVSEKLQGRDLSDIGTHFLLLQFSISKEEQRAAPIQQMALALLSLLTAGRPGLAGSQNAYDLAGWLSWNPRRGKIIDNFFKLSTFLFQLLLQWGVLPWCFKPLSNKTGRNKWLKAADHRYLINVKRTSWVLSNSPQNWRLHASLQREIFHIFFLRRRHWGFGQKVIMRRWEVVGPPEFIIEHSGNCHLEPL